jgi:hypothetical protein
MTKTEGIQIVVKTANSEKSIFLQETGEVIADSDTYKPKSLSTHVAYRIPDYPAVVYHMANLVNGVLHNVISIYVGLQNDQLKIELLGVSTPKGASVTNCVIK